MNWISNYVRPKIQALVQKSDVPENLWVPCGNCGKMVFHRDLERNAQVCPHCEHHMKLDVISRLESLFDDGKYKTINMPEVEADPLKFKDKKKYPERLKDARSKTKRDDVIVAGLGKIGGRKAVVAAFDFKFMGGSMGMAVGEAIVKAAETAVVQNAAFIVVPASGGARMQEGILSLMQMSRTTIGVDMVKEAGLPYIVILTDPTTGGVSASFAMLGDIQIAEPGSLVCFAGARVIEETIREKLPEGFQRAEYLLDHGMVDMVVHRKDIPSTIGKILDHLMN